MPFNRKRVMVPLQGAGNSPACEVIVLSTNTQGRSVECSKPQVPAVIGLWLISAPNVYTVAPFAMAAPTHAHAHTVTTASRPNFLARRRTIITHSPRATFTDAEPI